MIENIFIFCTALFMVVKGATLSTTHASHLAAGFRLSKYTTGFIVVAVVSILPEVLVSINAAIKGIPEFGLGTLLGSNVADLTLVFALVAFLSGRGIKIESTVLGKHRVYPFVLLLPIILGFDGYFSRVEGLALLAAGVTFYYLALRNGIDGSAPKHPTAKVRKHFFMFLFAILVLLIGAHFTVVSATALAALWGVSPVVIGMLVVGLGTVMPETVFSLKSVKHHQDSLAIGDILGTVLADATIVIGILALINPFAFPQTIIYVAGVFMVASAFILFSLMRSGWVLTRREGIVLFIVWLTFAAIEFVVHDTAM